MPKKNKKNKKFYLKTKVVNWVRNIRYPLWKFILVYALKQILSVFMYVNTQILHLISQWENEDIKSWRREVTHKGKQAHSEDIHGPRCTRVRGCPRHHFWPNENTCSYFPPSQQIEKESSSITLRRSRNELFRFGVTCHLILFNLQFTNYKRLKVKRAKLKKSHTCRKQAPVMLVAQSLSCG